MAGPRGPVPKRSEQRRRRNADSVPQKVAVRGHRTTAPPIREDIHQLAARWYAALADSGQSRYYEPSDWAHAAVVAEAIDAFATEGRRSSMLGAIMSASSNLLVTEGDRRRLRLELTRTAADPDEDAAVTALDDYRHALGAV